METNYLSNLAIHPGELLEETLEDLGMSQAELAQRMGRPKQMINEIIKGKKSITPTTALELEGVLGVPAHIWLGLENEYQMVLAKEKEKEQIEAETALLPKFPYSDLAKLGFVKATRKAAEKVKELRRFFNVARLGQIDKIATYQPAFRVGDHTRVSHESVVAWIQAARIRAREIPTQAFDKERLVKALEEIRPLLGSDDIQKTIEKVRDILAESGVAFVLLSHFKKSKINGATFWIDNQSKAVVAMSLKGSYADIFWFSFFHEMGHLILHNRREVFLEDGYDDDRLKKQEEEADRFASDFLIPPDKYEDFIARKDFSVASVRSFARQVGIPAGIVVGRLMYDKFVPYSNVSLNALRTRYKWA
jgi:HTH-type transcriptional regulator/antitoxin HigA